MLWAVVLRANLRALGALSVTVFLWGSAFAAIRVALKAFTPLDLVGVRLAVASVALLCATPFLGLSNPGLRRPLRLVVVGLVGMPLYQFLLNSGEVSVPAGIANVLGTTALLFATLIAALVLGERITRFGWVGIAVAFTGVVVVSLAGGASGLHFEPRAGFVLAAALALGSFLLLEKPLLAGSTSFAVTAYATWGGTLPLLVLAPWLPHAVAAASLRGDLAAVYLGLGPSALGYLTWAYAVARIDVSFASSALYLCPLVAFAAGFVLQGEVPSLLALLGGLVALAGVVIVTHSRRETGLSTAAASQPASGSDPGLSQAGQ